MMYNENILDKWLSQDMKSYALWCGNSTMEKYILMHT